MTAEVGFWKVVPLLKGAGNAAGFEVDEVPIENRERRAGQSHCGSERFVRGALDLFSVLFGTRYLGRALHVFGSVGTVAALAGLTVIVTAYGIEYLFDVPIHDTQLFFALAVLAMILEVQLFSIGLVCQLIVELSTRPGNNYQFKTALW